MNITGKLLDRANRLYRESHFADCQTQCVQAFKSSFLMMWRNVLDQAGPVERLDLEKQARQVEKIHGKPLNRFMFGEWIRFAAAVRLLERCRQIFRLCALPIDPSALDSLVTLREKTYREGVVSEQTARLFLENLSRFVTVCGDLELPPAEGGPWCRPPVPHAADETPDEGNEDFPEGCTVPLRSPPLFIDPENGSRVPAGTLPAEGLSPWADLLDGEREVLRLLDARISAECADNRPSPEQLRAWCAFYYRVRDGLSGSLFPRYGLRVVDQIVAELSLRLQFLEALAELPLLLGPFPGDPAGSAGEVYRDLRRVCTILTLDFGRGDLADGKCPDPSAWVTERFLDGVGALLRESMNRNTGGADYRDITRRTNEILGEFALELIPVEPGRTPFDPALHQKAASVFREGKPPGVITEMITCGVREKGTGTVVRPAQVAVNQT